MLGCSIDFIIKDLDTDTRSVVASRMDAMIKKRQMFYFSENEEGPMLYQGRVVEARIIAVAPKAVRLEVFGVEVSVRARDMAWEWMVDANDKFQVGDLILVAVNKISIPSPENIAIEVDAKSATTNTNKDNLKKCHKQGKYAGIITDVYKGTYFIRLSIGVNAVAHSCNMTSLPSKRDEIGFVITRINDNYEVAEGIITRQNLKCVAPIVAEQYSCIRPLMCTVKTIWIQKGTYMYVMDTPIFVMPMLGRIKTTCVPKAPWQMEHFATCVLRHIVR